MSILRNLCCWTMAILFPLALMAADTGSAILQSHGGVWVNGNEAPESTTVFPGDVIETKSNSIANLNAGGSTVLIQPESVVKFQDNSLSLEHGSVSIGTSKGMKAHINCVTVAPATGQWTQYDVTDVNAAVLVNARKLDVNVFREGVSGKSGSSGAPFSTTVHEGQQNVFDESQACGSPKRPDEAGSVLGNPKWIAVGAGAGAAVLLAILLHGGGGSSPAVSPSAP